MCYKITEIIPKQAHILNSGKFWKNYLNFFEDKFWHAILCLYRTITAALKTVNPNCDLSFQYVHISSFQTAFKHFKDNGIEMELTCSYLQHYASKHPPT